MSKGFLRGDNPHQGCPRSAPELSLKSPVVVLPESVSNPAGLSDLSLQSAGPGTVKGKGENQARQRNVPPLGILIERAPRALERGRLQPETVRNTCLAGRSHRRACSWHLRRRLVGLGGGKFVSPGRCTRIHGHGGLS